MTEQPISTDSKTVETPKVETTQPEKEVAVGTETPKDLWSDYEQDMAKYRGATKTDTKEDVLPAEKVETKKPVEAIKEGKPETKVEETKEASENIEELPEVKIEDLKIKRKDEEVPLMKILQEFQKEGKLQEFVEDYTSKRWDYYSKTQEHSKTVKERDAEWEARKQEVEILEMRNLVNELGEANLKDITYFENAVDKEGNIKYDDPEKAFKDYMGDVTKKGKELKARILETRQTNENTLKDFANKNGLDYDYCDKQFLPVVIEHIIPFLSMEQKPFKQETLDIFYKGLTYDEKLRTEKELSFKEGQKTAYTEQETIQEKSESPINSSQEVQRQTQEGWGDYENSINKYLNRG